MSNRSTNQTDAAANFPSRGGAFVSTRWSIVLAAGRRDTPGSQAALETLCQVYWLPLYAYVRRRGFSPEDAQDLTQEFFHHFLRKRSVATADPNRGRFRSFLLASLKHFLADEWDRRRALKRGGHVTILTIDFGEAEERLLAAESPARTPEQIYERRWGMTLLRQVYLLLEEEHRRQGKEELFTVLSGCLGGERQKHPYPDLASRLGMGEGAVRVAVHRLRKRYRELLRETVAQTVADPADVEEELRYLIRVMVD